MKRRMKLFHELQRPGPQIIGHKLQRSIFLKSKEERAL